MSRRRRKLKHGRKRAFDSRYEVVPVNPNDKNWTRHRFILWFGAYGSTRLMVWANHLEDALDEAIDWLVENAPGHIVDDQVNEAYNAALAEGKSEEEAIEEAEADTTTGGNAGNHILSYEWGIVAEDPSRADVLEIQRRTPERRASGVDRLALKRQSRSRRRG